MPEPIINKFNYYHLEQLLFECATFGCHLNNSMPFSNGIFSKQTQFLSRLDFIFYGNQKIQNNSNNWKKNHFKWKKKLKSIVFLCHKNASILKRKQKFVFNKIGKISSKIEESEKKRLGSERLMYTRSMQLADWMLGSDFVGCWACCWS